MCVKRRLLYRSGLMILSIFGAGCAAELPSEKTLDQPPEVGELSRAVARGDESETIRLIKQGADINENVGSDENRITPLLIAVADGNEKITHRLIRSGASLDIQYMGYGPGDYAAYGGQDSTLQLIQSAKFERNQ